MRSGRVANPLVLYMKEYGSDRVDGALSTKHQNYYAKLCKLDDEEMKIESLGVGLGVYEIQGRYEPTR